MIMVLIYENYLVLVVIVLGIWSLDFVFWYFIYRVRVWVEVIFIGLGVNWGRNVFYLFLFFKVVEFLKLNNVIKV